MAKEGYHSVTLADETFSILTELSKNANKSIPKIIDAIVTGHHFIHGILFHAETVCLSCGHVLDYCAERSAIKCPFCNSDVVVTRYVKVETRGS